MRTRELELSLGTGVKQVERNESETVVLQRRCIRLSRNMDIGDTLNVEDLEILRPCPEDGIPPFKLNQVLGKRLLRKIDSGDYLRVTDIS
jgi:N-acetylneuraminate synthase